MLGSCSCLRFASCWMPVRHQRPIAQPGALLKYCLRRCVPCSRACHLGSLSSMSSPAGSRRAGGQGCSDSTGTRSGDAGVPGGEGSSQGKSALRWAGSGLQSPGVREAARGSCRQRECELCSTGPDHVLLALLALPVEWTVIADRLVICS